MSTSTVRDPSGVRHHATRPLVAVTHRFNDATRRLNDLYCGIVQQLRPRPDQDYWRERSRSEDRRTPHPLATHIAPLQSAIRAAIETGDPLLERAVRVAIDRYLDAVSDEVQSVGAVLAESVSPATLISEHSSAAAAIACAAESASLSALDTAEMRVRQVIANAELWLHQAPARRREFAPRWKMAQ